MILNLKEFNRFIVYHHFKMDNIESCVRLMKPGCFMASTDLSDAYFSVPVDRSHQKYLTFLWKRKLYQSTCLAQGLACARRGFTKLLKPVFANLRLKGHVSSGYLDDSFLEGDTSEACSSNVQDTLTLLGDLDFCPNLDKSVVQPTQVLEHLGFILNSLDMSVSITDRNFGKLLDSAHKILQSTFVPVRLGPVVERPDNFILWISHYPTVSICAKISVFPLVQANMYTLTTVKLGSVRKPWITFNVKFILDPK